jgi:PAS domain S-box-containing protein
MTKPVRILFIEDCETDALLMASHLEDAGFDVDWIRVETAADLTESLKDGFWDVAVCDFRIPGFGAEPALEIAKACRPDLPFIVASGVVRVGDVVDLLRMGAHDFVEKSDLDRLVVAVERALDGSNGQACEPYRAMVHEAPDAILLAELDGRLIFANRQAEEIFGYSAEELTRMTFVDLHPAEALDLVVDDFERIKATGGGRQTVPVQRKDGTRVDLDVAGRLLDVRGHRIVQGIFREHQRPH